LLLALAISTASAQYLTAVRKQWTFETDQITLEQLLTKNVQNSSNAVNIVGISISPRGNCKLLVKIVVGTDDPTNPADGGGSATRTNKFQNDQMKAHLDLYGIKYTSQKVIQIFNIEAASGTPGAYRVVLGALVCQKIEIISSYFGEPALINPTVTCTIGTTTLVDTYVQNTFFEVRSDQVAQAKSIIDKFNTGATEVEAELCINIVQLKAPNRLRKALCHDDDDHHRDDDDHHDDDDHKKDDDDDHHKKADDDDDHKGDDDDKKHDDDDDHRRDDDDDHHRHH